MSYLPKNGFNKIVVFLATLAAFGSSPGQGSNPFAT